MPYAYEDLPLPVGWGDFFDECCMGPIKVNDNWTISNLGAGLIALGVLTTFACLFYYFRDMGPEVWKASWMNVFYGYLLMQVAGALGFLYFFDFQHPTQFQNFLFGMDMWAGYWIVGQYLVVSPIVDIFHLTWNGPLRAANYLLSALLFIVVMYFELFTESPWENQEYMELMRFTQTVVYLGNFLIIIQIVKEGWCFTRAAVTIVISTVLNAISLYLRWNDVLKNPNVMNCIWYLFEGISLVLIWFYFVMTRGYMTDNRRDSFVPLNGAGTLMVV